MKKSVVMFRLLDKDWTALLPQRSDYQVYRGSNREIEPFNGGVSVVFPIPQSSLENPVEGIDLQLHVHRELSKYFELQASQSIGLLCVDVSDLFNRVIAALNTGRASHPRRPVSSSMKDTYPLLAEDGTDSGAQLTLYLRVTHLGHSVISEIEVPENPARLFYAREETSQTLPYQCREITTDELTSGCWGSGTLLPPRDPRDTICCCCGINDENSRTGETATKNGGDDTGETSDKKKKGDGGSVGGKKDGKERNDDDDDDNRGGGSGGSGKKKKNGKGGKGGSSNGDSKSDEGGAGTGDENKSGDERPGEAGAGVSCIEKPALCGREGTCNKKDKKGKFGKCGRPDGEGGNPLACGERRKCALRRSAAGSATVGIVDKRTSCPPPPVCTCPSPDWALCNMNAPCTKCQPVYFGSAFLQTPPPYLFADQTNCRQSKIAEWR